jgi:hypothetical protein
MFLQYLNITIIHVLTGFNKIYLHELYSHMKSSINDQNFWKIININLDIYLIELVQKSDISNSNTGQFLRNRL